MILSLRRCKCNLHFSSVIIFYGGHLTVYWRRFSWHSRNRLFCPCVHANSLVSLSVWAQQLCMTAWQTPGTNHQHSHRHILTRDQHLQACSLALCEHILTDVWNWIKWNGSSVFSSLMKLTRKLLNFHAVNGIWIGLHACFDYHWFC